MSLVYLDTSCIIYLLEGAGPLQAAVAQRLMNHSTAPGAMLLASRLARLECRTKPLRVNDTALLARYEALFGARRFRLVDVSSAVIEQATDLRARYGFKTPDALHLATAILEKADVVFTGDQQMKKCTEVPVELVP